MHCLGVANGTRETSPLTLLWFLWTETAETWRNRDQRLSPGSSSGYMGIFLVGSLTDTLIWGFYNAFALDLTVVSPPY